MHLVSRSTDKDQLLQSLEPGKKVTQREREKKETTPCLAALVQNKVKHLGVNRLVFFFFRIWTGMDVLTDLFRGGLYKLGPSF